MNPSASTGITIVKLTRDDNASSFDCGNVGLNEWLKRFAWTNQQADSARTYVALSEERVVGYYAICSGSVVREESPHRVAKGLANHPIGVVILARLAVDRTFQQKGLGKALLRDALARIDEAADIIGIRAVLVHAIDEAARSFYLHFGFEQSPAHPFQLMLLLKDLRAARKRS